MFPYGIVAHTLRSHSHISVTVHVEREPQKGILVGKKGAAITKLRIASHKAIETFLGRKADFEMYVKVRKNWRKDKHSLREFGY